MFSVNKNAYSTIKPQNEPYIPQRQESCSPAKMYFATKIILIHQHNRILKKKNRWLNPYIDSAPSWKPFLYASAEQSRQSWSLFEKQFCDKNNTARIYANCNIPCLLNTEELLPFYYSTLLPFCHSSISVISSGRYTRKSDYYEMSSTCCSCCNRFLPFYICRIVETSYYRAPLLHKKAPQVFIQPSAAQFCDKNNTYEQSRLNGRLVER